MGWADAYVGLPPVGERPCWHLARRVLAECLGVELPAYDGSDPVAAVGREEQRFRRVRRGAERAGDVALMSRDGLHIGIVTAPGLVLHCERGRASVVESMDQLHVTRIMRWVKA